MTTEFLGARIQLNPRPSARTAATLEVGVLGHCPGRVRIERLLAMPATLTEIHQLGFGARLAALKRAAESVAVAQANSASSKEVELLRDNLDLAVAHLPIPLYSLAEFRDIFPLAASAATLYKSQLAGAKAWLPQAVADFFTNGGEKLWLVRIPEAEGVEGFLSTLPVSLLEVEALRGLACLLPIEKLALIILPDLERLQIPANLPDIRRKYLENPKPTFLPLGTLLDDGHRERRYSTEIFADIPTQPLISLLGRLLAAARAQRPDIQFLLSLPLSYSASQQSPAVDSLALDSLELARTSVDAPGLRQVQMLFPYLKLDGQLFSATGLIAGAIAANSAQRGIWRSVALQPLVSRAQLFPALTMQEIIALRESPGIGLLSQKAGKLKLDDERLMVPALHAGDYVPGVKSVRLESMRSAEVVRFIGYLIRELRELGENLIFNLDAQDPRPRLMLERFFLDLFRAGALRGSLPEQAFRISPASSAENVIAFDIEIAPAFPIDKIVITFVNRSGQWFAGDNLTGGSNG